MDTHSLVCRGRRKALHREIPRRCRCQEHHLPGRIVTGTSRRPPYRERDVGRGEWERERRPMYCCIVVLERQASHDHTTAAAAVTMHGGVAPEAPDSLQRCLLASGLNTVNSIRPTLAYPCYF